MTIVWGAFKEGGDPVAIVEEGAPRHSSEDQGPELDCVRTRIDSVTNCDPFYFFWCVLD